MHCACEMGNLEIVKLLMDYNADPNSLAQQRRKLKTDRLIEYWTPFHIACEYGNIELVKYLCENDADVNKPNSLGVTPLHIVSQHPMKELLVYLIENGADLNAIDKDRETPLTLATKARLLENVEVLISDKNIGMLNVHLESPVHVAARLGFPEILEHLLINGGDPNAQNDEGNTPLHLAVISKQKECVSILLEKGAEAFILNNRRQSPFVLSSGEITTLMKKVIEKSHRQNKGLRVKQADKSPRSTKKTPSQIANQRTASNFKQTSTLGRTNSSNQRRQQATTTRVESSSQFQQTEASYERRQPSATGKADYDNRQQTVKRSQRMSENEFSNIPKKKRPVDENDMYYWMESIDNALDDAYISFKEQMSEIQQELNDLKEDLKKNGTFEEDVNE